MAVIFIESPADFDKINEEIKDLTNDTQVNIKVSMANYDEKILEKIQDIAKSVRNKGCEVDILINSKEVNFKMNDLERFIGLEENCVKDNIGVYFDEGLDQYTLNDTLSAQAQIDEIVEKINKTNASPFEKYLMAYNYVTSKVYKENNKNKAKSRDLIAIFNGDDIVCVGYAKLMNRICKGIGIQSYGQGSTVNDKKGKGLGSHENNIVYIKDEKYGIDGYYYSDACWDSVKKTNQYKRSLNYCLIPLDDKDKMKRCQININKSAKLNDLDISMQAVYGNDKENKYDIIKSGKTIAYKIKKRNPQEYDKTISKVDKLLLNDKKRAAAAENLIKIFKKAEIPANVYSDTDILKDVPIECDYNYLLALLMQSPPNVQEVATSITQLKKFAKQGCDDFSKTIHTSSVDNIYNRLEMMSQQKSKTTSKKIVLKEGFNFEDLMLAKNTEEWNSMVADIKEEETYGIPYEWEKVKDRCVDFECAELEIKTIKENIKKGEAIPISAYREALKVSYMAQGLSEDKAEYQAELTIENTINRSESIFEEDANNSFRQEALKMRQEKDNNKVNG